jgi:molybdopterin synthase catalytic subunit
MLLISLTTEPINHEQIVASVECPEAGAVATFDGVVRNNARGKMVTHLFYEAYDGMALKEMESIAESILQGQSILRLALVHRIGKLEIGESSIFIAVSSGHRAEAFQACRTAIDQVKARVPIWKKEYYVDGEIWVDNYHQCSVESD